MATDFKELTFVDVRYGQLSVTFCTCNLSPTHHVIRGKLGLLNEKSPLPLTDPRDAVPQAHRAVHRCRRSVW